MANDHAVEVRRSGVEGMGVFAARDFAPGALIRVVNIVREITNDAPLRLEDGERREHCAYPDGRVMLLGHPDRHLNHSCDPNAWERHVDGRIEIVARRLIVAGEEISVDYLVNNSGGDSWPCNCDATRCRGRSGTSYFTLPLDQQREYLPLLADWFIARHPEQVAALRHR